MESLYKLAHEKSTDKGTFVKCPLHEQSLRADLVKISKQLHHQLFLGKQMHQKKEKHVFDKGIDKGKTFLTIDFNTL